MTQNVNNDISKDSSIGRGHGTSLENAGNLCFWTEVDSGACSPHGSDFLKGRGEEEYANIKDPLGFKNKIC